MSEKSDWLLNPLTNRYIKKGSKTYKTLVRSGVIKNDMEIDGNVVKIKKSRKQYKYLPTDENDSLYGESNDSEIGVDGDDDSEEFDDSDDVDEMKGGYYDDMDGEENETDIDEKKLDIIQEEFIDNYNIDGAKFADIVDKKMEDSDGSNDSYENFSDDDGFYNVKKNSEKTLPSMPNENDIDQMSDSDIDKLYALLSSIQAKNNY